MMRSRRYLDLLGACWLAGAGGLAAAAPQTGAEWFTFNKGYDAERYSPLAQINRRNVAHLKPLCETQVGEMGSLQSGILVVGHVLYLATPRTTLALDATTCAVIWRHVHGGAASLMSPSNRGPGYAEGRIFRGTAQGELLALDATTGRELWRIAGADPARGEFFSSAPILWQGRLYIGTSGGDFGAQARMMAYDARDGRELWRFNVIPQDGEPGAETWRLPKDARRAGGAIWGSYSLDPGAGELYVSTGNPMPGLAPGLRPGDNLYTNSLLALDAATGKLRWHLQLLPNDALDYDLVSAPMLYRDAHGRPRLAVAGKDGHLNLIDGGSHRRIAKVPVTTIFNEGKIPTVEGIRICPGIYGGVAWNGPAFDPRSKIIYVGAIDMCMQEFYHGGDLTNPAASFGTMAFPSTEPKDAISGWVTAVDGTTGAIVWKYHADAAVIAGVTPTAGGIVLTGDAHGKLLALDSLTGRALLKVDTGGALAGGVVTYAVDGRQYVAYAAGGVVRGNLVESVIEPKIVVAALDPPAGSPKRVVIPALDVIPPASTDGPSAQARGESLYGELCSICHGPQGDGMTAPRLRGIDKRKDPRAVADIIKDPKPGMARFYPKVLNERDVEDIAHFLERLK
jgi:alcohol dehydrogenase (cytochrome c)